VNELPSDWAVFVLAISILARAGSVVLSLFKSPKELNTDLAEQMRNGIGQVRNEISQVRTDVEDLRDDHHDLGREVSTISGAMQALKESLDGLRDQVTALTNVMGVYNAGRNGRR